jgi:hypothetical protein
MTDAEFEQEEKLRKEIAKHCNGLLPLNIKTFFKLIVIGFNLPDNTYIQLGDIDKTYVINPKLKNVAMNNNFKFFTESSSKVGAKYGTIKCKELEPLSALLTSTAKELFQENNSELAV